MQPEQTARTYDAIASHWASEDFPQQNGIAEHERALHFAPTSGRAIDLGCGASGRLIELLAGHGYAVEGLDISGEMLRLARERHPEVTFHHADLVSWAFPTPYEFISAWDSFWHVPLGEQLGVLRRMCAALTPGGVLIFTSGAVDSPGEVTNPCHGEPLYHAAPGISQLLRTIDDAGCVCRHVEYDQLPEGHLCVIVQKA